MGMFGGKKSNSGNGATFGVIGLGRFGTALAQRLSELGAEVLVIDSNERKIKDIRAYTDYAFVVRELSREALIETGIQNCETVVVCIGEKIDTCILTTLTVVDLGVPKVIAKATSYEQGSVLEKLGAEVIYAERDMAIRLAKKLTSNSLIEYIALNNEIEISELKATDRIVGKSVMQSNIRKEYGLNIIAIESCGNTITEITPDYVLGDGDLIVVIGKGTNIAKFEKFLLS